MPCSREDLTWRSPTSSPPASLRFSMTMSPPISISVSMSPVRVGFSMMFSITMSEPSVMSAATIGKAAEEGSPGTSMVLGLQLMLAFDRDVAAIVLLLHRDPRAEALQHALGVVARGGRLDDRGLARRVEAREQHGGLHLGRGHGQRVGDGHRVLRAMQRQRQAVAFGRLERRAELRRAEP